MTSKRLALISVLGAGAAFALSGCATLEKDECAVANWYDLGVSDGEQGRRVTRAESYRQDCGKFNIPIDEQSYRAGWQVGIRQFCTPERGFDQGINNRFYGKSCPAGIARGFEDSYDLGKSIYTLNENVDRRQAEIDVINEQLDVDGLAPESRRALRQDRRALRRDRQRDRDALADVVAEARRRGYDVRY